MMRVIGKDIHRTFAEVVFWQDGRLRWYGRVEMTRAGLEGFGRSLTKNDEVVIEATGNAMAVVRVLRPYVGRVIIANPLQVKAIAHARIKTDKIDAGVLASLHAAGFLPEVTRPTGFWRRIWCRRARIPSCSTGRGGPGSHVRSSLTTSGRRSSGTCASSTASARTSPCWTTRSQRPLSTIQPCGGC